MVKDKTYLIDDKFSVADALLYIVLSWEPYAKFDTKPFPNVQKYFSNLASLPFIKEAHGILPTYPTSTLP